MQPLKSVGIDVSFHPGYGWSATVKYSTMQFADRQQGIAGKIGTQYIVPDLSQAIAMTKEAAEAIGVSWETGFPPSIYVAGDGEDPSIPLPSNWQEIIEEQCSRLGWSTPWAIRQPKAE